VTERNQRRKPKKIRKGGGKNKTEGIKVRKKEGDQGWGNKIWDKPVSLYLFKPCSCFFMWISEISLL